MSVKWTFSQISEIRPKYMEYITVIGNTDKKKKVEIRLTAITTSVGIYWDPLYVDFQTYLVLLHPS